MQIQTLINALYLVVYLLAARWCVTHLGGLVRQIFFAGLNLAGVFYFVCNYHVALFLMYCLLVSLLYLPMLAVSSLADRRIWLAFAAPLLLLVVIRYLVPCLASLSIHSDLFAFVGISYLAFRCSRLVLEIRNRSVPRPGYWEYLNFAFFLPTMFVGPINSYANYQQAFTARPVSIPVPRAMSRILIGLVKYYFIGGMFSYLGYRPLLLDCNYHPWIHLPIAMVAYYLYLYCNFSGFCDMAIGAAGLIGISVPENFENPLQARNIKEFWNRWHITLSAWMRDIVFAPLSKFLVRLMGPSQTNHAVALTIAIVFLLVGIWHGVGWNYALFGAAQAIGVVTVHYYTIFLKKWLGRDGFKSYNTNPWVQAGAITLTFCYCAACFSLFANTLPQLRQIFAALR